MRSKPHICSFYFFLFGILFQGLVIFAQADNTGSGTAIIVGPSTKPVIEIPLLGATPLRLVEISPGSFTMGSESGETDETPSHRVVITRPFYLCQYEVTLDQYSVLGMDSYASFKDNPRKPVQGVAWFDAITFCNRLSKRTGCRPFFRVDSHNRMIVDPSADGFRLPTEAEWEYACRAGTTDDHFWGKAFGPNEFFLDSDTPQATLDILNNNATLSRKVNFRQGENTAGDSYCWDQEKLTHLIGSLHVKGALPPAYEHGPQPVGKLQPNPWGLFDMLGNVEEWCLDTFHYENGEFKYSGQTPQDPWFVAPYSVKFCSDCNAFHSLYEDRDERSFVGNDHDGIFPEPGAVLRGGAWDSERFSCRCSSRNLVRVSGGRAAASTGFRIVKNIPPSR